jgi:hypothetical protein
VELEQNTRMTLEAGQGARLFGLISEMRGKRIWMEIGKLTARVAKQKAGQELALSTPHATATVLGTVLQLAVAPASSELRVQEGTVEMAAGDRRELVGAGESAIVRDGVLSKVKEQAVPSATQEVHEDGAVLFQDSFGNGFGNWILYTKQGQSDAKATTQAQCPDIRLVKIRRDGAEIQVAELVGRAPDGPRVGIVTKPIAAKVEAFSLAYEYTYDGRPRRAMEGMETNMGREFQQKALPPGEWNKVRWDCVPKSDAQGRPVLGARLFFNGELIGATEHALPGGIDLILEVIEGQFRFANVAIHERHKAAGK